MKKIAFLLIFALVIGFLSMPGEVKGQVTIQDLGTIGVGDTISATVNFVTGSEIYVGLINLSVDCTLGSGNIMVFHTLDSGADTEIAIYGPDGNTLIAANDDGESGSWGDPGFDSLLYFGIPRSGNNDQFQGFTRQENPCPWPTDLPAGDYVLMLCTFETSWDEFDARDTDFGGFSSGQANVTIMVF